MHHGPEFVIVFLFAITLLVGALTRSIGLFQKLPFTVMVLLFGMLAALGVQEFGGHHGLFGVFHLPETSTFVSSDLIIFVFLPALIFESAFALDLTLFKKNLGIAGVLAVPALLVATGLTAWLMMMVVPAAWNWGWLAALVFGVLISATDPVAVVAILRELGVNKRLGILVESESLLNDGTAIVIFTVLFSMLASGSADSFSIGATVTNFFVVVVGGLAVGLVLSWIASFWIGRTFNDPLVEITLTVALAYLCMIIAEGMFHVSGVMALVVSGLWMGSVGRTRVSPEVAHFLHQFWEMLAYIANTLIFFLVGLVVASQLHRASWEEGFLIIVVYLGIMAIRTVVTFTARPLLSVVGDEVTKGDAAVLTWGGLRGAVSLALALVVSQEHSLPQQLRDQVLLVAAGVVLLTIVVNGSTMAQLLARLGFDKPPLAEQLAQTLARSSVLHHVEHELDGLSESDELKMVRWGPVHQGLHDRREALLSRVDGINTEIESSGPDESERVAWNRVLGIEREALWSAFTQGVIGAAPVRMLLAQVTAHSDALAKGTMTVPESRFPVAKGLKGAIGSALRRLGVMGRAVQALEFEGLARQYDVAVGIRFAGLRVLRQLESIESIDTSLLNRMKDGYKAWVHESVERLEELRTSLPEVTEAIETRLANRTVLNLEREGYHHLVHDGVLDEEGAHKIAGEVEEEMKRLHLAPVRLPVPSVDDLLLEVPLFSGCSEGERHQLAECMTDVVLAGGEWLFKEGDKGDSLFVVVRGAVEVLKAREAGGEEVVTLLGGGTIFGEMSLLTGEPRSASIRAKTPVALLKLTREQFDKIAAEGSLLRTKVGEVYAHHCLDNHLRGLSVGQLAAFGVTDNEIRQRWTADAEVREINEGDSDQAFEYRWMYVVRGEIQTTSASDGAIRTHGRGAWVALLSQTTLTGKTSAQYMLLRDCAELSVAEGAQ